ncbi:hypothetical protein FRC19_002616 [Serendipita sp. 401]|nr:hypothetical protein FRC19_002616 [Serendipita sp. 401]
MFANGVTFMPVLVGGQTFTLEAHGMHELEPAPEMHNIPSPFDDWTCEEFDRFERETWPLLVAPQDLGNLVNLADDSDDAVTPLIVPATPTEASWSVPSPKPPTELENDDVIAETETMSASSTNLRHRTAPSSDLTNRVGVSVSSADAGPQGTPHTLALLSLTRHRFCSQENSKEAKAFPSQGGWFRASPPTTDLDGLFAPTSNAHILQVIKGKETIQCRFACSIKEGVWVASQGESCGVMIQGLESYRRHVIQCHLDVARIADKK